MLCFIELLDNLLLEYICILPLVYYIVPRKHRLFIHRQTAEHVMICIVNSLTISSKNIFPLVYIVPRLFTPRQTAEQLLSHLLSLRMYIGTCVSCKQESKLLEWGLHNFKVKSCSTKSLNKFSQPFRSHFILKCYIYDLIQCICSTLVLWIT